MIIISLFLYSCNPKTPSGEGRFEDFVKQDCSTLSGCDQLACVAKGCWCFKGVNDEHILYKSDLTIQNEKDAQSAVEAYFRSIEGLRKTFIETESLGHNWYTLYYEGDAYTVGPNGILYLIDCI